MYLFNKSDALEHRLAALTRIIEAAIADLRDGNVLVDLAVVRREVDDICFRIEANPDLTGHLVPRMAALIARRDELAQALEAFI